MARSGRGCVDKIFVLKELAEKCKKRRKEVYISCIDFEKVYEEVCTGETMESII